MYQMKIVFKFSIVKNYEETIFHSFDLMGLVKYNDKVQCQMNLSNTAGAWVLHLVKGKIQWLLNSILA